MLIISVKDNKNNVWKRNAKTKQKTQKNNKTTRKQKKKTKQKNNKISGEESYGEKVRDK